MQSPVAVAFQSGRDAAQRCGTESITGQLADECAPNSLLNSVGGHSCTGLLRTNMSNLMCLAVATHGLLLTSAEPILVGCTSVSV
jgi:hypothetical protein